MKKIITSSFLVLMGLTVLVASMALLSPIHKVSADSACTEDNSGQYCLIEPIPLGNGSATYGKYDGGADSAGNYINIIIKVFISIIGALGVVMIVLGGVQYMTTDAVSKKEGGKEMITNSILGLILALASWIILNTINPNLNVINLNPPPTDQITVSAEPDAPPAGSQNAPAGAPMCPQSPTINGIAITQGANWGGSGNMGDDATNRSYLTSHGVAINANNCPTVGSTGCTSVAGYTQTQLDAIVSLRVAACGTAQNCSFTLTGGTECWLHGTHGPGKSKADFAASAPLNTFVSGGASFPTSCSRTPKTFGGVSGSFLAEQSGCTPHTTGIHWHVDW